MESWQTEKQFGPAFSGRLNQSVMFRRCVRVMNMNWCSRMNEFSAFMLAECPQEDVTCNEPFYSRPRSCMPSRANWLLELDEFLHTLLEVLHHTDMEIITQQLTVIKEALLQNERQQMFKCQD